MREAPAFASGLCHHHLANRAARSKRPPGVATMRFVSGPDFKQLAEKHSLAETHSLAEKHSPVKGHGFQPCHNSSKMNRASAPAGLPSPSRTVPGQTHKRPAAVPTELPSGITAMRFVSGPDFKQLAEKHSSVKGHGFQPCHNSSKRNRALAPAARPFRLSRFTPNPPCVPARFTPQQEAHTPPVR